MPLAHLGVVDDRRQHVVELVRRGARQFPNGRQPLGLAKLFLENYDLLLKLGVVVTVAHV
jgi:hypothetical protein